MNMDCKAYLERFPLFQNCSKDEILAYSLFFTQTKFQEGEQLFSNNEPPTKVFLILSGKVLVQKIEKNGKTYTIDILGPNDILPLTSFFNFQIDYDHVRAIEDTTILEISKNSLEQILFSNITVKINYIKHVQNKILHLNSMIQRHINQDFFHYK